MTSVTLTPAELRMAALVGLERQLEALSQSLPDRHGYEGEGWNIHIEGAAGELALAKWLGRYWDGSVNTFQSGGDVGEIQVRTRSKEDYDLLVRPGDKEDAVFVLVIGKAPRFRVVGWIRGADAKRPEWLRAYGGRAEAYFVPQHALKPVKPAKLGP